jgi:hypothetical protein
MAIKYIHLRPSKIYPNWNFWLENKPSGNPVASEADAFHTEKELKWAGAIFCFLWATLFVSTSCCKTRLTRVGGERVCHRLSSKNCPFMERADTNQGKIELGPMLWFWRYFRRTNNRKNGDFYSNLLQPFEIIKILQHWFSRKLQLFFSWSLWKSTRFSQKID